MMNHTAVTGDCSTCHSRPSGHAAGKCSDCHATNAWKPARAGHAISLTGDHTTLACGSCHKNGVYTGLTWACTSCHAIKHSSNYSQTCGSCHGQTAWEPATMNHAAATGDCSACHASPGGHPSGYCNTCHTNTASWVANLFLHPRIDEHSSKSFPCMRCHPSGYATYSCLSCHDSNDPDN